MVKYRMGIIEVEKILNKWTKEPEVIEDTEPFDSESNDSIDQEIVSRKKLLEVLSSGRRVKQTINF